MSRLSNSDDREIIDLRMIFESNEWRFYPTTSGGARPMASAVARACVGGLGADPPTESRGRAPGQAKPPAEAEALLVFGRSMEAANLPTFLQFGNAKKSVCVTFAKKITSGHETGEGGLEQNWGLCPPPAPA